MNHSWGYMLLTNLFIATIKILFVVYGGLNLFSEEAQYWLWSRHLDWSYYSKPPLVAYVNWLSTHLFFGNTELGIRINAIAAGFVVVIYIYKLTHLLFRNEGMALTASLLIHAVPLFALTTLFFTTDSLLLLFWTIATFYFWKVLETNAMRYWVLLGIICGLGFLSKYTMVFFLPVSLLFILIKRRDILYQKGYYFAVMIAALFCLPEVIWNFQNDFVSFKHLLGYTDIRQEDSGFNLLEMLQYSSEYLGGQLLIVSVFFVPILINVIRKSLKKPAEPALLYLSIPVVFTFVSFLLLSFFEKVEVNWPIFAYISVPVLIAYHAWHTKIKKKLTFLSAASFTPILLLFALPLVNASTINKVLPPSKSPFKRLYGWDALGQKVSELKLKVPNNQYFIFTPSYHIASELSFYTDGNPATYCINLGRRMNQFDIWQGPEQFEGRNYYGMFVDFLPVSERVLEGFAALVYAEKFEMRHGEETTYPMYIYLLKDYKHIVQNTTNNY